MTSRRTHPRRSPSATRRIAVLLALALLASLSRPCAADTYFGAGGIRNEVKGDFDDSSVLVGRGATYDLPTIRSGDGPRYALGIGDDPFAFEVSYALTRHRAPGALRPDGYPTKLYLVGFDLVIGTGFGKRLTGGHGQIYTRIGITTARLRLDGAGYGLSPTPFDVEFKGGGLTLGGGVQLRLAGALRVYAEYDYRRVGYGMIVAPGEDLDIRDSVSGQGSSVCAGVNFVIRHRHRLSRRPTHSAR